MNSGRSRLALAGGSEDRKDMLMKVGLGVLMAAVAVAIFMGVATSSNKSGPRGNIRFECQECGHKFGLSVQEVSSWKYKRGRTDYDPPQYECPECKKMAALRLETCPACEAEYVPSKAKKNAKGHTVCPHCNVDIMQYRRDNK